MDNDMTAGLVSGTSKNGRDYTLLVIKLGEYETRVFLQPLEARYLQKEVGLKVQGSD